MSVAPAPASPSASAAHDLTLLPPQRILCLCLGNICRSPLAEGVLRREVERRGLKGWTVDSAGTSGEHEGDEPDSRSIAVAKRNGMDISTHRAQQLTSKMWGQYDVILAMDASNYRNALRVKPAGCSTKLLMYLPSGDVPEYGSAAGFTSCYELLYSHVEHVFHAIHAAVHNK